MPLGAACPEGVEEAGDASCAALADVERQAQLSIRTAQEAAEKRAARIGDLDLRLRLEPERGLVKQPPAQKFAAAHNVGEMIDLAQTPL